MAALLLSLGLVGLLGACGFKAATNEPYTPSDGTNSDVGTDGQLKIRNLVIVSRAQGQGFVSATLIGNAPDQLNSVSVTPLKVDGQPGTAASTAPTPPLKLGGGSLVVLTNLAPLNVTTPDLMAGLDATVTMQFTTAGAVTLRAPVVDGTQGVWATVSPSPSPSGSATP